MPRTQPRRERGAAAVEMAIVLPLLLLMLGGIIDFGRFFMANALMTNAASEGTRAATVAEDVTDATQKAEIEARAAAAAGGAKTVSGSGATPTATFTQTCASTNTMKVTVTTQFNWLMLNAVPGITNPRTLSSTSVIGC